MGCCENRDLQDNDSIETVISEVESKLGLYRISVSIYYSEANSCFKNQSNKSSHAEFYKRLKINLLNPLISNFFNTYYTSEEGHKKLVTLGILLCDGSEGEKVKFLYNNYKEYDNDYLTQENVTIMVSDIYEISITELISFAKCFIQGTSLHLEKYKVELNSGREFGKNYYIGKIFEDASNNRLNFQSFNKIFNNQDISNLLNPSKLREATYKLIAVVQTAQEALGNILLNADKYELLK